MEPVLLLSAGTEESDAYARLLGLTIGELGCEWNAVSALPPALHAPLCLLDAAHPSADAARELCRKKGIPCMVWGWDGEDDECTLLRPVDLKAFSARCRALLAPPCGEEGTPVSPPRRLVLRPAARAAFFGGEPIPLTPAEYAVLALLWVNRGSPVPRETIAAQALNGAKGNEVDVYLRYLRKKIDQKYDVRLLVTVRGVGYMLRAEE